MNILNPPRKEDFYGKNAGELGRGAYGVVTKLEKDEKSVVMKSFISNSKSGEGVRVDTIREISILRRLNHPNIVKIIDVLDFDTKNEDSPIHMILEYASASLDKYIARTRSTPELLKSYMYQLSKGLQYLHDNTVIHRDIKPANILVFSDGRIAFADFGVSRFGSIPGSIYTGLVQTLWWRAPEILLGAKSYGSEIDVFSLGVVFVDMWAYYDERFYLFQFKDENEVLWGEIDFIGGATEEYWPGISTYPVYQKNPGLKNYAERHV